MIENSFHFSDQALPLSNLLTKFMMDVSQRLFRIMRSIAEDKFESIGRFIEEGSDFFDERLRSWEDEFDINDESSSTKHQHYKQGTESTSEENGYDLQLKEDLQLFGLIPPSSLEEVRQVRNREMKKFHPDKYLNQPDKLETAKRIVQIYNTTYDRLKKHYSGGI